MNQSWSANLATFNSKARAPNSEESSTTMIGKTINRWARVQQQSLIVLLVSFTSETAEAYIDPGTTGLLSQVLYVLFYAALGLFLYCIQYIKRYMIAIKHLVLKLLGRTFPE